MNKKDKVKEINFVEFESMKHANRKEILVIQDRLDEKRYDRKITYTKFLYDLKNDFLNKEQKSKIDRMKFAIELRKGD